jgi:hypothetical protein
MNSHRSRSLLASILGCSILGVAVTGEGAPIGFAEDFESQTVGQFPTGWLDIGLVDPTPPDPPIPSAFVVETTDAFGQPTRALAVADAFAFTSGIYRSVPLSSLYESSADVRVDRFSNNSSGPPQDWAMAIGINRLLGTTDPAFIPSVQLYTSSLTESWRIFITTDNAAADVDLGVPVALGTWYGVEVSLDVFAGTLHSRITDIALGSVLVDRVDSIDALDLLDGIDQGGLWDPLVDGIFDIEGFMDGEVTVDATIANLAVVDNIDLSSTPIPEPLSGLLLVQGLLLAAGFAAFRRR